MKLLKKILVANRGEIAVRIIISAKKLGIQTVAIYADNDKLHISKANESYSLGSGELKDTYLNIDKIIQIALQSNCEAIHPGYGFLAENGAFVDACKKAGLIFIGPSAESMKIMGNKIEARNFINKINIPTTKGATGDIETLKEKSKRIPFPVLIKAAAGGGGKGMRIVHHPDEIEEAIEATSREATNYFGDGTVYLEQFIENPRHIEIQILSDHFGNHIHLLERECSIQRRYQKIIEESPAPTLTEPVRAKMGETAIKIAREIGYQNAGTIEFLVDKNLNFYFLEMNTRVQVEHPVTEMVTGIDIVEQQLLIAAGNKLKINQTDIQQNGHAIESRIYAEDPEQNFMPAPGKMTAYKAPLGKNIRVDTAIETAITIDSAFDPMISKLIIWSENREKAIQKSVQALKNYYIHGLQTNTEFLLSIFQHPDFLHNEISTKWCEQKLDELLENKLTLKNMIPAHQPIMALLAWSLQTKNNRNIWEKIGYWRDVMHFDVDLDNQRYAILLKRFSPGKINLIIADAHFEYTYQKISENEFEIQWNSQKFECFISEDAHGKSLISINGFIFRAYRKDQLLKNSDYKTNNQSNSNDNGHVFSPMPGKIIKINVAAGDTVKKGDALLIVEAMKMENSVLSQNDGIVKRVHATLNESVDSQKLLIELE